MGPLEKIDNFLAKAETLALVVLLTTMIALSFGQVLLRNLFNQGILWADIFLRQLVLWVGFLGASLAVRERKHIAIEILPQFLSDLWKKRLHGVVDAATGTISALLFLSAWDFVQLEAEAGSVLFLDIPVWIFQAILPFSFAMITLRIVIRMGHSLLSWRKADQ